ncbi:hypothetical protein HPB47_004547 [Ixodes persulcatus]|uniref:Uncharacterized protein n=1 Tax=Ixodes persulcatus TaxID=34615 RepID=A0AC60PH03_IXOPE|nr:hypothetical protein HPB47_004547 [Ixodes persulcatus]
MLFDQYDEVLKRLNVQGNDINGLNKRVDQIERAGTDHEAQELKSQLNDLEWRSRRQNLEIHGVCETEREGLLSVVNDAAKPGNTRGIIERFARQESRELWLSKKRALNRVSGTGHLYIAENMRQGRSLLWQVKEWARAKHYRFVWYRNGKVFVRQGEEAQARVALLLCPLKGSNGGRLVIPSEIAVDDNDVSICAASASVVAPMDSAELDIVSSDEGRPGRNVAL